MLKSCWALVLFVTSACSSSSPTSPAPQTIPEFSIRFVLANSASLSLSEPVFCPGDWSTCDRGSQPQGSVTWSPTTVRTYALPPGTYRLTGILQANSANVATVRLQIGPAESGTVAGGVASDVLALGLVSSSAGLSEEPPSVVSEGCAATFSTPSGALEWSIAFRVIRTSDSVARVCAFVPDRSFVN
jgi:hypothetical protein